jgi:hypothetical protein
MRKIKSCIPVFSEQIHLIDFVLQRTFSYILYMNQQMQSVKCDKIVRFHPFHRPRRPVGRVEA